MDPIMRFPEAAEHDPAIDVWLSSPPEQLRSIARQWFALMRGCGDDVRELMHDGAPTACVGDGAFAYVNTFTSHINVGFFHGFALKDPARLLEGTGKRMRHVKLRPDAPIDAIALRSLIRAAYLDVKTRL